MAVDWSKGVAGLRARAAALPRASASEMQARNIPTPPRPSVGSSSPSYSSGSSNRSVGSSTPVYTPQKSVATSSGGSTNTVGSSVPTPPKPASWMGDMYKPVAGTDWWSTNPDNPNAARYNYDGTPVASVGFDHTASGGGKGSGWTTQENFQKIINAGGAQQQGAVLEQLFNSGQVTTQNQINKNIPTPPMPVKQVAGALPTVSKGAATGQAARDNDLRLQTDPKFREEEKQRTIAYMASLPQNADKSLQQSYLNKIFGYEQSSLVGSKGNATGQTARDNDLRLQYDPAFREEELARAYKLIADNPGKDVSSQLAYIDKINRYNAADQRTQPVNASQPTQTTTTGDAVTNPQTEQDLRQSSGDSLAIERAEMQNVVDRMTALVKNNAEYANQLIQDNRTLEDFNRSNVASPFSGRTSYDNFMIGRQRSIDDNQRSGALEAELNAIQQDLYNFDKLAPERQRQIYNDLLRMERDFALNVGQLTGTYGGQRTLAGQAQDYAQSADQRDFNYRAGRDSVSDEQWQRTFDFQKSQQEWENAFSQGQFDFQKAQQVWENNFKDKSFEQGVKEFSQQMGLDWSRLNQQQQQFVTEQAYRNEAQRLDREQFEFSKSQAENKSAMNMDEEKRGLVDAIRSGQITPGQALKQIEEDRALGFYTDAEVSVLQNTLKQLSGNQKPLTESEVAAKEEILKSIPSNKEIEAEARRLGYPIIDYRSFYKDPKGKSAGLTFNQWANLYGPSFGTSK